MRLTCCYKNQIAGDTVGVVTIGTFIKQYCNEIFLFLTCVIFGLCSSDLLSLLFFFFFFFFFFNPSEW